MALLCNGSSLSMLPIRQIGGGVHADLSMWNRSERRNSSTAFSPLAGIPYGHLAPSSWLLPVKPGGMSSSRFAEAKVSASASGVMGMPASGAASFSIGAAAEAQLIANGSGSDGFSVLAAGTLSASLNARLAMPWQYILAYSRAGPARLPSEPWLRSRYSSPR